MDIQQFPKSKQYLSASLCMSIGRIFLVILVAYILSSGGGIHSDHKFNLIVISFLWLVPVSLSVLLSLPLKCPACGKRVSVIKNTNELSQSYMARQRNRTLARRLFGFFWPEELRTGLMHCVHCNHAFHVHWR